ncbi:MAG: TetR/AcrR family transcriptional regulator, ethionamide resistance regulator [Thermoleophilaceae bacterium]|jgi:AcrR family transcriptional regulator|nr:TetR/AcrR family transcriptional regulator, ethionamide resistance regulator [Thermoleophilaceae bacterium]
MTERQARPRTRDRAGNGSAGGTEAAILDATQRLLGEMHLEELTVAHVLDGAGVSRATFYFYFESKQAVVAALLRRVMGELFETARGWFDHDGDEPQEALRQALHEVEAAWREHAAITNAAVEGWRSSPELGELWGELVTGFSRAAARRIERDRAAGLAPPGPPARPLAAALVWMDERAYYLATSGGEPALESEARVAETLAEIWLRAVYGVGVT